MSGRSSLRFTECWQNTTADHLAIKQVKEKTLIVIRNIFGLATLPFAVIGLIVTVIFFIAVCRLIKKRQVSRKCFTLILNRSTGDVITCTAAVLNACYIVSHDKPSVAYVFIFDTFIISSFWSATISYCLLSVVKFLAVAKPFYHKSLFTMKKCVYLVIVSWLIFGLVSSLYGIHHALLKIEFIHRWSDCRLETCTRKMYQIRDIMLVLVYFGTIFCFLGTGAYILQARRFTRTFQISTHFPMWKLGLNVATFAFFNAFYVVWIINSLFFGPVCHFVTHFDEMMLQHGLIRILLILRIISDPIVAFASDHRIRRVMLAVIGCHQRPLDRSHISQPSSSTAVSVVPNTIRQKVSIVSAI